MVPESQGAYLENTGSGDGDGDDSSGDADDSCGDGDADDDGNVADDGDADDSGDDEPEELCEELGVITRVDGLQNSEQALFILSTWPPVIAHDFNNSSLA